MVALSPGFRQFIGFAEILAACGLVLPGATRILTWLTPLVAGGLMIVMGGAVVYHLARREIIPNSLVVLILFALTTVTAYLRWKVIPL